MLDGDVADGLFSLIVTYSTSWAAFRLGAMGVEMVALTRAQASAKPRGVESTTDVTSGSALEEGKSQ